MSIPRSEYPRPELVRSDNWLNLNGQWQFAFDFGNSGRDRKLWDADDAVYTHEITVPFAPESKLSGIEYVDFIAACWYRRTVVLPEKWCVECGRILLHFGAVDYRSEVYVNGKRVGSHVGGYTPFTFDVTEYVVPGENRIAVFAEDNGRDSLQPTGKQVYYSYYNSGCSYTRSTGIWQTVWMEYVPQSYVSRLKITPCIDGGEVSFGNVTMQVPPYVDVTVTLEGKRMRQICGTAPVYPGSGAVERRRTESLRSGDHGRRGYGNVLFWYARCTCERLRDRDQS